MEREEVFELKDKYGKMKERNKKKLYIWIGVRGGLAGISYLLYWISLLPQAGVGSLIILLIQVGLVFVCSIYIQRGVKWLLYLLMVEAVRSILSSVGILAYSATQKEVGMGVIYAVCVLGAAIYQMYMSFKIFDDQEYTNYVNEMKDSSKK